MQPESLSKAIQLSVAPVFLLAGIGALMNVISARLARIVDAARQARDAARAGEALDVISRVNLTLVVVPLFIAAMSLLMLASLCFLREVQMASRHLRELI